MANNQVGANPFANTVSGYNATMPQAALAALHLLQSQPSPQNLSLLRQNAVMSPIIGASQAAMPGYSAGLDQSQVAGLRTLAGVNPLEGFQGYNTAPTPLAPMAAQMQQQANINREQNLQRAQAAIGLGGQSQDYLNSLSYENATNPLSRLVPTTENLAILGNYGQTAALNALNAGNQMAPEALAATSAQPAVAQGIRQAGAQQFQNAYGLPNTSNPYSTPEQTTAAMVGQTAPQLQQQYQMAQPTALKDIADPTAASKDANTKAMADYNNQWTNIQNDPAQNPEMTKPIFDKSLSLLQDPQLVSNMKNYFQSKDATPQKFMQSSVFKDWAAKAGFTTNTSASEAMQSLVSDPRFKQYLMSGSTNPAILSDLVNQQQATIQSKYNQSKLTNDIMQWASGNNEWNVNPTKISQMVKNNPYMNPGNPISSMHLKNAPNMTTNQGIMEGTQYYQSPQGGGMSPYQAFLRATQDVENQPRVK